MLYFVYTSIVSKVIQNKKIHGYADDHAITTSFHGGSTTSEIEEVNVMQNTVTSTSSWISENHLKVNDSKTEFIMYGSWQQLNSE